MKLYYKPGACSLASHIMLYEIGADFEIEAVDTVAGQTERGQNYRDINANGYVPSLETDGGEHLSEGVAILQFLADSNPERAYSPAPGSVERARLQQFLNFAAAELHKAWGPLFADGSSDAEKQAAQTKVATKLDYLETVLADDRDFLVGNQFSVADAYVFVLVNWANFKAIDLATWPKLAAYTARIANRPSTKSAFVAEGLAQ
ncbi:glutathione transferase GstA [uncultured Ruegeria sp.]|uniref:glutathione transferase GstA n=1 Tax=uncultured Ruegeria sp. TaxID=259304 RepID=UPI002638E399|nr:glutathione transferase GstA [uncultured Ruegeria sp.]